MSDVISPLYRSAFVPHDIETPVRGAAAGPLAGLTAAVKDMYDIAGTRTGNGNPTWETLMRYAQAIGVDLRIQIVRP